jgi:hypothetical protein
VCHVPIRNSSVILGESLVNRWSLKFVRSRQSHHLACRALACVAMATALTTQAWGRLYFTDFAGGTSLVPFGTVDALGNKTYIGSGLDLGSDSNRSVRLLPSPNGDLYGFNLQRSGTSNSWGRINPSTGAFTLIGDLRNTFSFRNAAPDFQAAFDADGTLFATGFSGSSTYKFGVLDVTTGSFSQTAVGGGRFAESLVSVPEPSTFAMAFAGLACGGFSMWRRRKRA